MFPLQVKTLLRAIPLRGASVHGYPAKARTIVVLILGSAVPLMAVAVGTHSADRPTRVVLPQYVHVGTTTCGRSAFAGDPESARPRAPSKRRESSVLIGQVAAISRREAIQDACGASPTAAKVHVAFMRKTQWEALGPVSESITAHSRYVWVVTVHADILTDGSLLAPPVLKHVYTVVINATTGAYLDFGLGAATLG